MGHDPVLEPGVRAAGRRRHRGRGGGRGPGRRRRPRLQFDPISLEAALGSLNAAVAGCERLADTPTPRHYDSFTRLSVATFATLLPCGLLQVAPPEQDAVLVLPAPTAGYLM